MTEASCASATNSGLRAERHNLDLAYATTTSAPAACCHKTKGFEVATAASEGTRKPGPILTKFDSKLTPDWVKTWIRNPRAVKPATWMPRIWYNSNSSSPADATRNEVEINAVATYLFANAEKHEFAVKNTLPRGMRRPARRSAGTTASAGARLPRGEGTPRSGAGARRTRPAAENIGNKITYEWVFNQCAIRHWRAPSCQPAAHRRAGGRRCNLPDRR
jgi:hypothetical protein